MAAEANLGGKNWNTGVMSAGCVTLGVVLGILLGGGIAPPVVNEPWLKSYQTLAAAFVALSGGVLAYLAAMAKVNADRDTAREDDERRKVRIAMHLNVALVQLIDNAKALPKRQVMVTAPPLEELKLDQPPELDEIWDNLEIFDKKTMFAIASLRYTFSEMKPLQAGKLPGRLQSESWRSAAEHLQNEIVDVIQISETIRKMIAPLINTGR